MNADIKAVLPRPSNVSRPFWEACNRGELLLPRCEACDHLFFYPRIACPKCGSSQLGWQRGVGRGSVFSFSHVQMSFFGAAWDSQIPYTVVLIDLDDGVRFLSRLVGERREQVAVGSRVILNFVTVDGQALPFFRLAGEELALPKGRAANE